MTVPSASCANVVAPANFDTKRFMCLPPTETRDRPYSACSDSHHDLVRPHRAGHRRAPRFPCDLCEEPLNVWKAYLPARNATIGLRYKFSTGQGRTGHEICQFVNINN